MFSVCYNISTPTMLKLDLFKVNEMNTLLGGDEF